MSIYPVNMVVHPRSTRVLIGPSNGQFDDSRFNPMFDPIVSDSDVLGNVVTETVRARNLDNLIAFKNMLKHLKQFGVKQTDTNGFPVVNRTVAAGQNRLTDLLRHEGFEVSPPEEIAEAQRSAEENLTQHEPAAGMLIARAIRTPGFPINAVLDEQTGETLLHKAVAGSPAGTIRQLLTVPGMNVNSVNLQGRTALHYASIWNKPEVVQDLIQAGADPNARDTEGMTPLALAVLYNQPDTVNEFLEAGRRQPGKLNLDIPTYAGRTALAIAAFFDCPAILQALINAGANPDQPDDKGRTPLHHAVRQQRPQIIKLLIRAGAKLNQPDHKGKTPLHEAAEQDMDVEDILPLLNALVKAKANLNLRDEKGQTPFFTAVKNGRLDLAKRLPVVITSFENRPNINQEDHKGRTPLAIAKQKKKTDMVNYLRFIGARESNK